MRLNRVPVLLLLLGLGVAPSCQGGGASFNHQGVVVTAPSYVERLAGALDKVQAVSVSAEGAEKLSKVKGRALVDRPDKVRGVPEGLTVEQLPLDGELWAALDASEEDVAADMLIEKGVEVLLLNSQATPSVDRGKKVLSRLYHHDHLSRFTLFRVGEGLLYYKVLKEPVSFDPRLAAVGMSYLRHRLKGGRPGPLPPVEDIAGAWTLMATIRQQGQEMSVAFAQDKNFQVAIEELVEDLERDHRRNIEVLGFPPLAEHADDLTIELHRVTERAYVEPRDEVALEDLWEMGIDGAYMMTADLKERAALPGATSYTRAIRDADRFLRVAAEQGRMSERRPWRDPDAWLELIRTVHYIDIPGQGFAYLYRGIPAIPMEQVSMESVRQGVIHAGDWYLRNMAPTGQVVYKFWPEDNRYSSEYNLVRHTLATWNLVQSWEMDKSRQDFLDGAKQALEFTQRFLKREPVPGGSGEMMAYYSFNNNQKLGTVVVNMLGMIDLARATGDHSYDEQLKEMGRFVLYMQEDDGSFNGYYVDEDHDYYGMKNDIVPGEAALALVYLAEYFDDDQWIASLDKYWSYYQPWFKERVAKGDWDAPWPAETYDNQTRLDLVQFGPWTVMAANAYHARTGNQQVADFGLEIARWMLEAYQWDEERAPFPDYVGGYYKLPGELPAMQAFCYAEGTAAAYRLALRAKPEDASFFEERTRETVRFALQMQYDEFGTYAFTRPEQVDGGIRYAMNETKVRIDYVHHALSAMYQWYKGAEEDANLAEAVKAGPALPGQQRRVERRAAALAEVEEGAPDPTTAYTGTRYPVPMASVAALPPPQKAPGQ